MSQLASPVVSVVMSVFNGEKYLEEAIRSILEQSFRDFEFIVIDDGSVDRSIETLQMFAAQDSRIRLVARENRGLTKSLNEGCALARGEFIARMDADDTSWPSRFESQLAYLASRPEIVACGTGVTCIDSQGFSLGPLIVPLEHEDIERSLLTGNGGAICHPSLMVRRHAFIQVAGYDDSYKT
ncbi:MAG: glycosyltransferase, partial [Gammaproteobacteria bacterium]